MNYRRILPLAVGGAIAISTGILSIFKGDTSIKRYKGSHLNDNGLKQYTFVDSKKFELLNVTVLLRHGARTPNYFVDSKYDMPDWESGYGYSDMLPELDYDADVKELPSLKLIDEDTVMDEYIDHVKGKCQWGQLTLIGQEQSIVFGKELKRIYIDGCKFLQKDFNDSEIYCRSTKFPRTFYTLKGIISGIYGIKSFDRCHRPIIYTMTIGTDPLYPNTKVCPVIGQFIISGSVEISNDSEIKKMKCLLKDVLGVDSLSLSSPNKKNKKEQNQMKSCDINKSNEIKSNEEEPENSKVNENVPIYAVRDDFFSRQVHEFPVPNRFSSLLSEMNRLASEEMLFEYLGGSVEWEDRMVLLISPTLNFIKSNMKEVLQKSNGPKKQCLNDMKRSLTKEKPKMKMQLLSCHDTTLIPLLVCLRIYDNQWPTFMSNIIVELYKEKSSQNIFTRVLYNGRVQHVKMSDETSCDIQNAYSNIGLIPYSNFVERLDKYSIPEEKYSSACDKALQLFSSGKPVTKDQFV